VRLDDEDVTHLDDSWTPLSKRGAHRHELNH